MQKAQKVVQKHEEQKHYVSPAYIGEAIIWQSLLGVRIEGGLNSTINLHNRSYDNCLRFNHDL